jgi:hypothetical protein
MPFYKRLVQAPLFPLSRSGLLTIGGLALVLLVLGYMGVGFASIFVVVIRNGIYWSYVFYLIRQTASGTDRLGTPEFRNVGEDIVMPLIRGIIGTSLVWFPAFLYIATSDWSLDEIMDLTVLEDPVLWLFAAGGIVYAPMAIIAAATDIGILGMLNPIQIFGYIRRTGIDYFVAIVGLILMIPLHWVIGILGGLLSTALPIPVLSGWLMQVFSLYPMFVWAHVMGLILFVHGHALDWGDDQLYQEPILPGVEPRGERVLPAPKPDARTFEPIDLTPMSDDPFDSREAQTAAARPSENRAVDMRARTPAPRDPFAPPDDAFTAPDHGIALGLQGELSAPPLPIPVFAGDDDQDARPRWSADLADSGVHIPQFLGPAADVKRALADKKFEEVVSRFTAEPAFLVLHLNESELFMVGAALAQFRQVPLAIDVLKRIAFSADLIAPKAMFLLARLYADARKDYDNAERLFRTIMKKFPDSREAAGAKSHLQKLGY